MVNASEDKHVKRSNHMENINSEKYSRGRRGAPAKGVGRATGARVQIPLSPLGRIKLTTIWLRAFSMGFLKLVMKSYLLKASQG